MQVPPEQTQLLAKPKSNICCDLVVAAPTCVQLSGDGTSELTEPPLIRGMNILIGGLNYK